MANLSFPGERRLTKAERAERAAARKAEKPHIVSDEEFAERVAAMNRENPLPSFKPAKPQETEQPTEADEDTPPDSSDEKKEIERLKKSAASIIASKNVLDLFAGEFRKVIAGEQVNGKLLYLVATSRMFEETMHAAVKGTSAGGKSEIRKRVLDFFPPESVVSFTSLTEKSLIYFDGDFSYKILSMGEAAATEEQEFQDYLLRVLMSEKCLRHATTERVGNTHAGKIIEKKGPVSFLVTTTKSKLHPENETRMLSLEIDDSAEQTRRVMTKVAQIEGLNQSTAQIDVEPWLDYQRWLERGERRVVVPFADKMVALIPAASVRLRRDVGQVIRAIKAHALLHREHRDTDDAGQILAAIGEDYRIVRELMIGILAAGSGVAIPRAMTETIAAVQAATAGMTEAEGASAQDVARKLGLDKSAAWRRLTAARQEGYIANLEQRKGMPGKYRVTSQEVTEQILLPTVEEVVQEYTPDGSYPPETVQPCNGNENPKRYQEDDGCKDGCKSVDGCATDTTDTNGTGATCNRQATADATVKSLNGKAESLEVARLQAFSGGMTCHVRIREVRHPAISAGPDDDLNDFQ